MRLTKQEEGTVKIALVFALVIATSLLLSAYHWSVYKELQATQELLDWVVATNQQHEYTINNTIPGCIDCQ